MRGNEDCRVGTNATQSTEGAASGGSVGRIVCKSVETHHPEIDQPGDSSLISTIDITRRDLGVVVRGQEKESEGAIVAMEAEVNYSKDHIEGQKFNAYNPTVEAKGPEETSKKTVRTWKRVARGNSGSPQLGDLDHSYCKRKISDEVGEATTEVKKGRFGGTMFVATAQDGNEQVA
ncbi:hypothetical protein LWI29_002218 [Acer saccharum]|uniref:Uncharacterized protein n=1 Tax=Acer saccharum TaxID=4024 RepID=A0AA39V693_ACESA|nr:hypothetical protein LWI29_002218 [Acer saccharum]